ncbi:MAG: LysR substrate-binding domain-containing protein, partial [Leifsonia sp.]
MFDPVLLRTFVAVAETLSFTRAGELLELSQPTVSQQVRKLEAAAGRQLVARDTRAVSLTDNGDAMLGFARSILAAHDEAAAYFTGSAMRGRLRFGSADDLALTQLPQILRDFRQLYPQINLELTVNQSGALARRLKAGQLDLVYIKQEPDQPDGRVVRRERLVWVAHKSLQLEPDQPVPLIAYQAPSLSRTAAIHALEDAGRTWRI